MANLLKRAGTAGRSGTEPIWHLNCGTMCPRGGKLFGGQSINPLSTAPSVAHCLLIESGDELVLVDTGFGLGDCEKPRRLGQPFRALVRPQLDSSETAFRLLWGLDLDPRDVRHIITTHLDLDHAGGLGDFPWARVHVFEPELAAARKPALRDRARYRKDQWAHNPNWVEHEVDGDEWFGFESVRLLTDLDVEIALVPLVGHSAGHTGVAVKTGKRWLLHCGDAFFHHGEIESPHHAPAGIRFYQKLMEHDGEARQRNLERLRELAREHGDEVTLICSHDPLMMAGA